MYTAYCEVRNLSRDSPKVEMFYSDLIHKSLCSNTVLELKLIELKLTNYAPKRKTWRDASDQTPTKNRGTLMYTAWHL